MLVSVSTAIPMLLSVSMPIPLLVSRSMPILIPVSVTCADANADISIEWQYWVSIPLPVSGIVPILMYQVSVAIPLLVLGMNCEYRNASTHTSFSKIK